MRKVHEGRRSWLNGVQKALVIGGLLEKAGEFDEAQQRIRDEANRKRADAAKEQIASQARDDSGKVVSRVVPQPEGRPGLQEEPIAEKLVGTDIEDNQSELLALVKLQKAKPDVAEVVVQRLAEEPAVTERLMTGGTETAKTKRDRKPLSIKQVVKALKSERKAAERAGLAEVPCWVREMSDDDAYMQLVLCNTQSELHPLEEGKHAAESGLDLKAYAEKAGKNGRTLHDKVKAWRVLANVHVHIESARDAWRNLAEIHAAPEWLWPALVAQMIELVWPDPAATGWRGYYSDTSGWAAREV